MEEEESKPLSQVQHQQYRSQVARCLFLSSPNQQSLAKLKRLARYLKRERKFGQVFEDGKRAEELIVVTDSGWVGCKETRKSSSAGVLVPGRHTLKADSR